jgi:Tle cognate immunity protein 4 C-terminal domain/Tle cognate immunity protein 4 N-terminal domain
MWARLGALKRWQLVILALGATGLIVAILRGCIVEIAARNPNRSHTMTEYTKDMKTVCIGRYVLDIPARSRFAIGSQGVDSIKIERLPLSAPNAKAFVDAMAEYERRQRSPGPSSATRDLFEVRRPTESSRIFLFYEDHAAKEVGLVQIEGRGWLTGNEYSFRNDAASEYLEGTIAQINRLVSGFMPIRGDELPTQPGLCIDGGFIVGAPFDSENLTAGVELEGFPGVGLSITSETSGRREAGHTLLDRTASAKDFAASAGAAGGIEELRKAEVTIDRRKGQEYVAVFRAKGGRSLDAKAEVYGDGTAKLPTFKINLVSARPDQPTEQSQKALSDEDVLAIWDAVLKSIRPRPGAF